MKCIVFTTLCIGLLVQAASASKHVSQHESQHASHHIQDASINNEMKKVGKIVPSITSIADDISLFQLESPTFRTVENTIAKDYRRNSAVVNELEEDYAHRSEISNQEEFDEETKAHKSLAKAISELAYVESEHSSFASKQEQLQSAMFTDTDIVNTLREYTKAEYPSVAAASAVIENAVLTDTSVFTYVVEVDSAMADSETLSTAMSALSTHMYTLAATVDDELLEVMTAPSNVAGSILQSLETCYPTAYTEAAEVASYLKSHTTVESAVTAYLTAAESVQSIGSAVALVVSYQEPSVYEDIQVMTTLENSWPSAETYLSFEQQLLESSPALNSAAHTIQAEFAASPLIAESIFIDIDEPSQDTNPQQLAEEEAGHASFVKAVEFESQWEDEHPQYAKTLAKLGEKVISELAQHSSLVTLLSSMSRIEKPHTDVASHLIAKARSVVPSLSTVIYSFDQIEQISPKVTCAESVIASYDTSEPSLVESIWQGLTDTASISDISEFSEETAKYPTLIQALDQILSITRHYSSFQSVESALILAEQTDSNLLTQWSVYAAARESLSQTFSSMSD